MTNSERIWLASLGEKVEKLTAELARAKELLASAAQRAEEIAFLKGRVEHYERVLNAHRCPGEAKTP